MQRIARILAVATPPKSSDVNKTQGAGPPDKPPKCPSNGNYCFKATTTLVHDSTGFNVAEFNGYSGDMQIVDVVEAACERRSKSSSHCADVKLVFMGPHPKCDGRVEVSVTEEGRLLGF